MLKVILKGYILIPEQDLNIIKEELIIHKQLTLAETGCLVFEVTPDPQDPKKFNVYEEFKNKAAFEHHQSRVKASNWGKVTAQVERHYEVSHSACPNKVLK